MYRTYVTVSCQDVIDDWSSLLKGSRKWQGKAESTSRSVEYKETLGAEILVPEGCVGGRIARHWPVLSWYRIRRDWAWRASENKSRRALFVYFIRNVKNDWIHLLFCIPPDISLIKRSAVYVTFQSFECFCCLFNSCKSFWRHILRKHRYFMRAFNVSFHFKVELAFTG